jgi:hypothetical protein
VSGEKNGRIWRGLDGKKPPTDRLFTRYPEGDAPPETITATEAFRGISLAYGPFLFQGDFASEMFASSVVADIERFEETGNPVYALHVLADCHNAGVYPPPSVIKWISRAITTYLQNEGAADLHALLGLIPGVGKAKIFDEYQSQARKRHQYHMVKVILAHFPVKVDEACVMVAARDNPRESEETVKKKARGIKAAYYVERRNGRIPEVLEHHRPNKFFLGQFPPWSIPDKLKTVS